MGDGCLPGSSWRRCSSCVWALLYFQSFHCAREPRCQWPHRWQQWDSRCQFQSKCQPFSLACPGAAGRACRCRRRRPVFLPSPGPWGVFVCQQFLFPRARSRSPRGARGSATFICESIKHPSAPTSPNAIQRQRDGRRKVGQ